MKVKNIAFSGFAAAILAAGAANAATVPQIASKQYVDTKVKTDVDTLQTTIENTYTKTEDLGTVINQNITNAMTADDGALKTALEGKQDALDETQMDAVNSGITTDDVAQITQNKNDIALKENKSNKQNVIDDTNKNSADLFPTIGAVVSYTNAEITKLSTDGLPVNPAKITDGTIAAEKLTKELQDEIAGKADKITVTTEQVGNIATLDADGQYQVGELKAADLATKDSVTNAITNAVTDNEALKGALADKANADDVYTKTEIDNQFDNTIPRPEGACAADSGRCVLSVATGEDGITGLQWLDITKPVEETTPTTGA